MRIVIATVTASGGYVAAAAALEEAWRALRPADTVERVDLSNHQRPSPASTQQKLKGSTLQRPIPVIVCGLFCIWLWSGCGKPAANSRPASAAVPVATNPAANATTSAPTHQPDGPKPGEKVCFACKGTGLVKCVAPGCVDGRVDCPGPCLKLDRGTWVHMEVAGHPASDVWQKFDQSDGSWVAYNQGHVGHVIEMQNGRAVDSGPCKICNGTGKVTCSVCNGTDKVVCPICGGKKFIPTAWTPVDNPWLDSQPDLIRLNDGRILFGQIISTVGTDVTIKTRTGQWLHVDVTNIAPKPEVNSTNSAI